MLPGHAYLDVQFKGTCSNCDNKFEILRSIEYFEKDIPINQYFKFIYSIFSYFETQTYISKKTLPMIVHWPWYFESSLGGHNVTASL